MFTGWFQTSYDKLIEAESEIEAQSLIAKMDIAELNKVDNGETALTLAVGKRLSKVCEMLISKMTDQAINYIDKNNDTALTLAAGRGLDKVCEMLIPKMSEQAINYIDKDGYTALTWAAANGYERVCKILIPKMSNEAINQITNNGETVLSIAKNKDIKYIYDLLHKIDHAIKKRTR
ncbi:MAG: ankyrin repeat domain-containing protein [Rickettsia endosymbiont of Glossina mortisans submortisans]|nr:ankyrin repeat domain-containing protein [Rickettsia endosymbiont of Glossina mortisans submortisans]